MFDLDDLLKQIKTKQQPQSKPTQSNNNPPKNEAIKSVPQSQKIEISQIFYKREIEDEIEVLKKPLSNIEVLQISTVKVEPFEKIKEESNKVITELLF
jgi:hypothetical protein